MYSSCGFYSLQKAVVFKTMKRLTFGIRVNQTYVWKKIKNKLLRTSKSLNITLSQAG
jgi:hypothetical protein